MTTAARDEIRPDRDGGGRLAGKVALVTGAARGQGRSHASRLAADGADVIAIDVCDALPTVPYPPATVEDLEQTAELVRSQGRRVVTRVADVRDGVALGRAVDEGVRELGRLDIVVANAGIASYGAAAELEEQQWQQMIDINLSGVWRTVKVAVPHLRAGGAGGAIVITSSESGLRGIPNTAHYASAKHGVVGLMKVLALELGRASIRVNTVHPCTVDTPMVQNESTVELFLPGRVDPTPEEFAAVAQRLNVLPIPWVQPEDVSALVAFLVSDEARYITGAAVPVDAGQSVRW